MSVRGEALSQLETRRVTQGDYPKNNSEAKTLNVERSQASPTA